MDKVNVSGDSFGTFGDSMFGELSRQQDTNSSLGFARTKLQIPLESSKTRGFSDNPLKDIINKGVHDTHSMFGNTLIWVDLTQNPSDVDTKALLPLLLSLINFVCRGRRSRFASSF